MSGTTVNVDDVSQCPLGRVCESCGSADDLSVCTLDIPVGVICMTLCDQCVETKRFPKIPSWHEACALVLTHCEHLGIDLDEMAEARAAERAGTTSSGEVNQLSTRLNGRGMSTVDIEKTLQSDDAAALGQLLDAYRQRRRANDVLRECKDSGEPGDIIRRGFAEAALAMMKDDPVILAVDALRIERRVFELGKDGQWKKMMEAREEGASWEDIAAALDLVGNNAAKIARDWYVMRITALEKDMPADRLARARAVIDNAAEPMAGEEVVDDPPADDGES